VTANRQKAQNTTTQTDQQQTKSKIPQILSFKLPTPDPTHSKLSAYYCHLFAFVSTMAALAPTRARPKYMKWILQLGLIILAGAYLSLMSRLEGSQNGGGGVEKHLQDFLENTVGGSMSVGREEEKDPPSSDETDPFYNIPSDGTNIWDNSTVIPDWMKTYFNWHKHKRMHWRQGNWTNERWLVMQCLSYDKKCGGERIAISFLCI
jgi:hypothetical protein